MDIDENMNHKVRGRVARNHCALLVSSCYIVVLYRVVKKSQG